MKIQPKVVLAGAIIALAPLAATLAPASPAHAHDFTFDVCDQHSGVVTGTPTSCGFAHNVAAEYMTHGSPLVAYSPAMNAWYQMGCTRTDSDQPAR